MDLGFLVEELGINFFPFLLFDYKCIEIYMLLKKGEPSCINRRSFLEKGKLAVLQHVLMIAGNSLRSIVEGFLFLVVYLVTGSYNFCWDSQYCRFWEFTVRVRAS